MKHIKLLLLLFLISNNTLTAQSYSTSLGLRLGSPSGISLKHFISGDAALEGILGIENRGFSINVLYEKHATAFEIENLNWYYGLGGYFGVYRTTWWGKDHPVWWNRYPYYEGPALGVSGIIGIEYNISEIPFNVSLDWKPSINIFPRIYDRLFDTALSVRYIIN